MGFAAGYLLNFHLFQSNYQLRLRLIWAPILIFGHRCGIRVAQLATTSTTPGEEFTVVCEGNSVSITASDLDDFDVI